MTQTAATDADRALKAKHRALWASGNYPAVAAQLIPQLGPELVRECGVAEGDRVLDVAAGTARRIGWLGVLDRHRGADVFFRR